MESKTKHSQQKLDLYVSCVILILIEIMKTQNIKCSSDSLLHVYKTENLKHGCNDR
jgi:hypothetical protein